jgi:hypothetical protein
MANKVGRPSKFDKIDRTQIEKLAKAGWIDVQMADFFGVTRQTWDNWKKAHPKFFAALKSWKAEADHKVERSLYERATGYEHPEDKIFNDGGKALIVPTTKRYPPDTTAAIFWLKNRNPDEWRDRHELTGPGGGGIQVQVILPDNGRKGAGA